MATPDPIRAALGRLINAVLDGPAQDDHPMGWTRVDDAMTAARAALDAAQPEGEMVGMTDDYTAEVWVTPQGRISDVRITRGFARYGRPAWWRRALARWFPWLLLKFHKAEPTDPLWGSVRYLGRFDAPTHPFPSGDIHD